MSIGSPALTLSIEDHGRVVSSEEFASADFKEPWTYERSEGRLVVMAPEGYVHIDHSRPFRRELNAYWIQNPQIVEDVVPQAWIRVDDGTDRIGDLGIYLVGTNPGLRIPDRVPDLMFEIVSPGRESHDRDYVVKRADYFRFGIREYVIVDPFSRKVTVLSYDPGGYQERILSDADQYTSPLLPGLVIRLAEAFSLEEAIFMATLTEAIELELGWKDRGRRLTDEEFADADFEEPWRYELADGRLVVMSPSSEESDDCAVPWREALIFYKRDHPGRIQKVVPEAWVLVRDGTQRIGDIGVFLIGERSAKTRPARVPEIMIEVVSRGRRNRRRDYETKRAEYHAIGVLEYLVVDRFSRKVTVFTHEQAGYREHILTAQDDYTTPLLPGFSLSLADVFRGPREQIAS